MRFRTIILAITALLAWPASSGELSFRILTFNGENPYEVSQTILRPVGGGLLKTEVLESAFKASADPCADYLSTHQLRALEVMLKNKYITRRFFDMLMDPKRRAHFLSQYILVTSFEDMPATEAKARNIDPARYLDVVEEGNVRVHMGSLFFVRGYTVERGGLKPFKIVPRLMPFELGDPPSSLVEPSKRQKAVIGTSREEDASTGELPTPHDFALDRSQIEMAAEVGRALAEKDTSPSNLQTMFHLGVEALTADAKILGVDPKKIPLFAHGLDAKHMRTFTFLFPARPMSPEMQRQLEQNPTGLLARYMQIELPNKEGWQRFSDGVVVASLPELTKKFPPGTLSHYAEELKVHFPSNVTAEQRLDFVRELAMTLRSDYDYREHHSRKPGRRAPIIVHDLGTGLLEAKVTAAMQRLGISTSKAALGAMIQSIFNLSLQIGPDFGQQDWLDRSLYFPSPGYQAGQDEMLPALVVSNFDPDVPSSEHREYLGSILLTIADHIQNELNRFNDAENDDLVEHMNDVRRRKGLPIIVRAEVGIDTFFETYDVVFASAEPKDKKPPVTLNQQFEILLGGDRIAGVRIENKFKSGKVDIEVDAKDFARIFQQAQKDGGESLLKDLISSTFQEVKLYRFSPEAIRELREELTDVVLPSLHTAHHPQKLRRLYITYQ